MDPMFLDTTAALKKFLSDLGNCDGQPPRLYVDLEGNNPSRNGTLSLVTILLEPESEVYLVDVTTLGRDAFTTAGADGRTLKAVLESKDIVKVFFDIRNNSDALLGLHDICDAGIEDLQLMELARGTSRNDISTCIERDSALPLVEKRKWKFNKERGRKLFDPALGGGNAVFDERPLSSEMERYCMQDVIHMPGLRELYRAKLCDAWWKKIEKETVARIALSQGSYFNGQGMHVAKSPAGWVHWKPSMVESQSCTLLTTHRDSVERTATATGKEVSTHGYTTEEHNADLFDALGAFSLHGHSGIGNILGIDHDNEDSDKGDLTTCDQECGYCGRCEY
ncbi:hypothetical protein LTR91_018706 [Friedmanniomyces endolithicus]|uniref:3'-5' exonuclease domain-containing protein n=1 Tax=Friedmanniomyces endolithicus TaxID=329885 RepID=A0AAN6K2T6_9PEZI|nr:hypothetical protein LTR02_016497 [Friedmanniomyces endolithicus]KAK0963991.1 hypothetical protein LTR91_018706 [Friedmanniomyces endolithicus]